MTKALVWYRLGLRVHDCDALIEAARQSPTKLYPVFTLDPHYALKSRVGIRRWIFLLESLVDLDKSLRELGSRLFVCRGNPLHIIPALWKEWGITHMYVMGQDFHPYSLKRDSEMRDLAQSNKVQYKLCEGTFLYNPSAIISANSGKPPLTYQSFLNVISKQKAPRDSLPSPTTLPTLDDSDMPFALKALHVPKVDGALPIDKECTDARLSMFKAISGPNGSFDVPDITELGFQVLSEAEQSPHRGGESVALKVFDAYMSNKKRVAEFEKPKTSPAKFKPADTTVLSPHIKFGTLSPRLFHQRILQVYKSIPKHSQPPVSLLGQLLWREFYHTVSAGTANYGSMKNNPICVQIPWWCAESSQDSSNPKATEHLKAWTEGKTGYPWIDAIMNQLRLEGWVHHLARHSVACFLTRGDLFISWERGAEVFEELLLDHDWALNRGNWMWLSASAFFHQYFRVYSPVAFGKKYDKEGKYIRKYVPVLKNLPSEFIYEPWKASKSVLKSCGIVLGENYPHPIVDHDVVSKENMGRMKAAYDAKKQDSGKHVLGDEDEVSTEDMPSKASSSKKRK